MTSGAPLYRNAGTNGRGPLTGQRSGVWTIHLKCAFITVYRNFQAAAVIAAQTGRDLRIANVLTVSGVGAVKTLTALTKVSVWEWGWGGAPCGYGRYELK